MSKYPTCSLAFCSEASLLHGCLELSLKCRIIGEIRLLGLVGTGAPLLDLWHALVYLLAEFLEEREEVDTRIAHLTLRIHGEEVAKLDVACLEGFDILVVLDEVKLDLVEHLSHLVRVGVGLLA